MKHKLLTKALEKKWNRARQRLVAIERQIVNRSPSAAKLVSRDPAHILTFRELADARLAEMDKHHPTTKADSAAYSFAAAILGDNTVPTKAVMTAFCEALKRADCSQNYKSKIGSVVRKLMRWAYATDRAELDLSMDMLNWPRAAAQKPRPTYSGEEYRQIRALLGDSPLGFIVTLGWNTGMSVADCCNLTWGDVDVEKLFIRKPRGKTGVVARIPIVAGGELDVWLKKLHADVKYALGSVQPTYPVCRDAYMAKHKIIARFKRFCAQHGIQYRSFHSFRTSMVATFDGQNMNIIAAMAITGHSDPKSFAGYSHASDEAVRAAYALVRTQGGA